MTLEGEPMMDCANMYHPAVAILLSFLEPWIFAIAVVLIIGPFIPGLTIGFVGIPSIKKTDEISLFIGRLFLIMQLFLLKKKLPF